MVWVSMVLAGFLVISSGMASAGVVQSTLNDQSAVSLTVYNANIAIVKDVRKLAIPTGEGELRFMDVASAIIPETVLAKSLTAPDKFAVLEQNYEYDLINRQKLLDKYVGSKIKIIPFDQAQEQRSPVEATLISNNDGEVYDINGEIFLGHPGVSVLPKLPENLIAKPTLTWMYANDTAASQEIEVAYMTNNVNWRADYVISLDKADQSADLSGWVTLDNKSGATYREAQLKLVAGKVNRAEPPQMRVRAEFAMMNDLAAKGAAKFQEEAFFEYHLYDLQRKTTIKDNQTKQISLLEAKTVPVQKEFIVEEGQEFWYWSHYGNNGNKVPVKVTVTFKNDQKSNLGMPLPAGIIRLYKKDNSGSLQFIGEDNVPHTPKDEEIRLKVGEAFDVVSERKQTSFRPISERSFETSWEIVLRNHKNEDITVSVIEPLPWGNTEVLMNSHPYAKLDVGHMRFEVAVPKDGEAVLRYSVKVSH